MSGKKSPKVLERTSEGLLEVDISDIDLLRTDFTNMSAEQRLKAREWAKHLKKLLQGLEEAGT